MRIVSNCRLSLIYFKVLFNLLVSDKDSDRKVPIYFSRYLIYRLNLKAKNCSLSIVHLMVLFHLLVINVQTQPL